jgi:processive 1,2-diacylglycerol beta-glucosyltransferase
LHGGYGFSRHWVNPKADLFIGAVPEVCDQAKKMGMAPERTFLGGFLLHPAFWEPRDLAAEEKFVREDLKLEPGRFTLLLSTGANSAQNHLALLHALKAAAPLPAPMQVVALCGKDERTLKEIQGWAARNPDLPVRALPHVRHLAQLMRVTSAVVARPGTGTTTEAILSGVPVLFNTLGGIMPQEVITVKFCREHGFGRVLRRPSDLAATVRDWLADPATLAAERQRVLAARPDRTPTDILRRLQELVATHRQR